MRVSRSTFLPVRGLQYHIRQWGDEAAPRLFMLHGWMDNSATFQFVVDHLQQEWHIIAPDWRGFGLSQWAPEGYWQPDYLADLEVILDYFSPHESVKLVGHSLGGHVGTLYAGIRPNRIERFVSMEGFSLMETQVEQARQRYTRWLDEHKTPPQLRPYGSFPALVKRFMRLDTALTEAQATFLAQHQAIEQADGTWVWLADPVHRLTNPVRYRLDEVLDICAHIQAPVLLLESEFSLLRQRMGSKEKGKAELERRASYIAHVRTVEIPAAGHMMQHNQPERVARELENFLAG